MNRHHPGILGLVASAVLLVFCACTGSDKLAGGTSETTNGITAMVRDQNGNAIPFAQARIRPQDYLADTSAANLKYSSSSIIDTFANSSGRFAIHSLAAGDYAIEFRDENGSGSLSRTHVAKDSVVDLGITMVTPAGSIDGAIDGKSMHAATKIYVLVRGMERTAIADPGTGRFSVKNLPQGNYSLRIIAAEPAYGQRDIENVAVISGLASAIGTVRLNPYGAWSFSRKLTLNTSPSGADIAGNLHGFPVLIRLNASNFDFSKAHAQGEDLRFATSDSIPLPYEIERWDIGLRQAEIWVRIDTLRGNSNSQFINMYWGNSGASGISKTVSTVFDTSNGFEGVWHLQDRDSLTAFDASINRNIGANSGAVDTIGIIGNGKRFTSNDSIVIPGLMNSMQTLTLSAWVHVDSLNTDSFGGDVISLGDAVFIRVDEKNNGVLGGFHANDTDYYFVTSGQFLADKGWHHIAFTYDGVNRVQSLFIDGVINKTEAFPNPITYAGIGINTLIGAHGLGKTSLNFEGVIDEVRIHRAAVSADWIKLSYANQGTDDKLVIFSEGLLKK